MDSALSLIDGDMTSLEHRISRVLANAGPGWRVLRFTYWYTGRPPLHEARVIRG